MSGHARNCASVADANVAPNQAATAGWKSCQIVSAGARLFMLEQMGLFYWERPGFQPKARPLPDQRK
jgi:hypothetical protein